MKGLSTGLLRACIFARINAGYTLDKWDALDYGDRVFEVALNRMRDIMELHKADAMALEVKRRTKPKR